MLRITIETGAGTATLKLEGKLAGPWVAELEHAWRQVVRDRVANSVLLDLCDVTFIAAEGKEQLRRISGEGGGFKTSGCLGRRIVEEILGKEAV